MLLLEWTESGRFCRSVEEQEGRTGQDLHITSPLTDTSLSEWADTPPPKGLDLRFPLSGVKETTTARLYSAFPGMTTKLEKPRLL